MVTKSLKKQKAIICRLDKLEDYAELWRQIAGVFCLLPESDHDFAVTLDGSN